MNFKLFFITFIFFSAFYVFSQPKKDVVAVPVFYTNMEKNDLAIIATDNFIESLTKSNRYVVVERSSINKVFNEQNMSSSEEFNQSKAVKLGELIGANTVIIGSLNYLDDTYIITVKGVDVEKGTVKFSENIKTKKKSGLTLSAREIGYSVSFYVENSYKAFDMNIGGCFSFETPVKLSKKANDFFVWPLHFDIGVLSLPVSFTYFVGKKVSVGATFSPGLFVGFIPLVASDSIQDWGYAIFSGSVNLKLLFRLKAEQSKKNYKFVFETGLKSNLRFIYEPLKQSSTSVYRFGVDMGPVFSFGVENRKNANFFLEYSGFLSGTFDVIPFSVYSTGSTGLGINIVLGMEIKFGYYNLFPKYEKRLGVL